ncbi:MAG: EFR1 family ferrodoxin [Peptoniphilaceae bacterium]|nr:EFR1 family ferrodoxin [Peptoniphilaceae bacterium]MDD7383088.1 EFR1 family ferrodoxin [Peptoniphilaceae bacterium]MDY3737523.1 EFR1 family ferrodoxin [Peptoniphilaceae bacterium]
MLDNISKIYFSATGQTEKCVNFLANELSKLLNFKVEDFNFTKPADRKNFPKIKNSLVILATPVYAGRVPNLLLKYLENFNCENSVGITLVTFGNRAYDDALIELTKIEEKSIPTIASCAICCEHSFSNTLGKNRPDEKDFLQMKNFAKKIAEKIKNKNFKEINVKGNIPFRNYMKPTDSKGNTFNFKDVKVKTNLNLCIDCKICAKNCPLGTIDFDDVSIVKKCMKCNSCVKKCPTGAKYFDDENYLHHKKEIEEMYKSYKKSEYFL